MDAGSPPVYVEPRSGVISMLSEGDQMCSSLFVFSFFPLLIL